MTARDHSTHVNDDSPLPSADSADAQEAPRNKGATESGAQRSSPRRTVRVVNWPLVLVTLACLVVTVPGLYWWHGRQIQRLGATLNARAMALAEEDSWREAADYTHRYLRLHPEDAPARIRLAQYFKRSLTGPGGRERAIDLHYQALGVADDEQDVFELRRGLAELLLELGRFPEARREAQRLIDHQAEDAEAHRVRALALFYQFQASPAALRREEGVSVGAALEQAYAGNPADIELATILAATLRQHPELLSDEQRESWPGAAERSAGADAVLDQLLASSDEDSLALVHLTRFQYRQQFELPGVEEELAAAMEHGPDSIRILLAAAGYYAAQEEGSRPSPIDDEDHQTGAELAMQLYRRILETLDSRHVAAYVGLGDLYVQRDQPQEAVALWRRANDQLEHISARVESRLAAQLMVLGELEQAEEAIRRLEQAPELTDMRREARVRRGWQRNRDLLMASLRMQQERPMDAIGFATPVSTSSQADSSERLRAWLVLGEAYGLLGDWDRAAVAYDQAVGFAPDQQEARMAAGIARLQASQPVQAAQRFERAWQDNPTAELAVNLGRAWLVQQAELPRTQRDWSRLEDLLERIERIPYREHLSEPWRVELLRADYALLRALEAAEPEFVVEPIAELLTEAEAVYGESAPFWLEIALRYHQIGRSADLQRALERVDALAEPSLARFLVVSGIHAARRQFDAARETLDAGLQVLGPTQQAPLRRARANLFLAEGDLEAAIQELTQLHQDRPRDIAALRQLADLAIDTRQWESALHWENVLHAVEGEPGTHWRYVRARRLLLQPEEVSQAAREEAARLQVELQQRRPSWARTHVLLGLLDELNGDWERALAAYQDALRMGDRRVQIFERVVSLLYRLGRFAEANRYLARLERQIPASTRLSTLAISVASELQDSVRAETLAQRAVERRPNDPMAWLWYGQMLMVNEQPEEAEQAFRRAIALGPQDVQTWAGLFNFQIRAERGAQARETLAQLREQAELPPQEIAFALAQGYDALGDREQAEENYRRATELAEDSVPIVAQWAAFLLRQGDRQAEVEPLLRRLISLAARDAATAATAGEARRALATLVARRGEFDEAMQLLQYAEEGGPPAVLDQRLQALLYVQRPEPDLDRAQALLEDVVVRRRTGEDGDHLLLASVYRQQAQHLSGEEQRFKLEAARRQYETLSIRTEPQPEHLAVYADFLMSQERWPEAETPLRRLEELAPDELTTVLLRTRWLVRQDRLGEVPQRVETFVQRREERAQDEAEIVEVWLAAARILDANQLAADAEPWYRKAVEADRKFYPLLVQNLVARGKTSEAIELSSREARAAESADSVTILANALLAAPADKEAMARAENLLLKGLANHPQDAQLALAVANVRAVQHRNEEAQQLYRQVLRLDSQNTVALNNLATLTAEIPGQSQQALRYIEQAIELSGEQPALLDTKGMILVKEGRADEAVSLLRRAVTGPQTDPRYHFHLAVALYRTGETEEARGALETALSNDLRQQILTASDLRYLQNLEETLLPGGS